MALKFLVALDGSEWSAAAGRVALELATRLDREVQITAAHVVNVTNLSGRLSRDLKGLLGFEPVVVPAAVERAYQERGRALLAAFAEQAAARGVACRMALEKGAVLERLVHLGGACDLVVAGTRGETESLYPGHGGTLERLIKRLRVSALLVPRGGLSLRGIALGYDGSEGSRVALRVAGHLSSWLGVPAHVIFAKDRRRDEAPLTDAMEHLAEGGVSATSRVLAGEPAEVLPAAMLDAGMDTLAVGFRGRAGLADRFLGRVTERLLQDPDLGLLVAR